MQNTPNTSDEAPMPLPETTTLAAMKADLLRSYAELRTYAETQQASDALSVVHCAALALPAVAVLLVGDSSAKRCAARSALRDVLGALRAASLALPSLETNGGMIQLRATDERLADYIHTIDGGTDGSILKAGMRLAAALSSRVKGAKQ